MNIKELAIQCGLSLSNQNGKDMEAFAQEIIKAYVAEQKPVAWRWNSSFGVGHAKVNPFKNDSVEFQKRNGVVPLYTLEVKP